VILGGGFGGLDAARTLAGAPVRVTLIDRHNYHLFQPLLYQVATAALSPGDVASPIRWVLRRQPNVKVLLANVSGIDVAKGCVQLEPPHELAGSAAEIATGSDPGVRPQRKYAESDSFDGLDRIGYDYLIVTTGAAHAYF